MTVLFLAGGEGKRMWPIATDKPLIEFLGKPLAWTNLKKINEAVKPEKFVIVTSSANQDKFSDITLQLGLKAKIAIQKEPLGMADAILSAEHFLKGECLVVNAEDFLELSAYATGKADVCLSAIKVNKYFPGGYLKVTGDSVQGIVEKPGEGNEPSDMVKLVVDYFKDIQTLISYLKKTESTKDDVYEMALNKMIEDGLEVKVSEYNGVWKALKYPWHILDLMEEFLGKDAILKEEGVKVYEGAIIKGPCYIGKNTIIGGNALVRESIIGANCVVGFGTEIARSYVGPDSWFHTNYVGDSVLEGDFGAGSGAVLANLRLDGKTIRDTGRDKLGLIAGKGVRIGVNASTMPGVRIGLNCLVGPGVVLSKDLQENTKVTQKAEYEYSKNDSVTSYNQFREKLK